MANEFNPAGYYNAQKALQFAIQGKRRLEVSEGDIEGVSSLGTEIRQRVTFKPQSYKTLKGDPVETVEFFLNDAIMTVTQNRNVIETRITGMDGSVNEYINEDNFSITISGTLDLDSIAEHQTFQNDTGLVPSPLEKTFGYKQPLFKNKNLSKYPHDAILELRKITQNTEPIEIESTLLNDGFGITNVYCKSLTIPQQAGVITTQIYRLELRSMVLHEPRLSQ